MLFEILPLVLFPLMLLVSGYMLSGETLPKNRMLESMYETFHVWHGALLIMVIHHIETMNFVVLYPLILAVYVHMMLSENVAKRPKQIVRAVVTLVAFFNTIISEEWALCISIVVTYLVIVLFKEKN